MAFDFENGSSHRIADGTFSGDTDHTHVALVTVEALPGAASYRAMSAWSSGTAARRAILRLNGDASGGLSLVVGSTTMSPASAIIPSTDGRWYLLGAAKAAGTVVVDFFAYDFSTGTWTESASSGTVANRTASAATINVGANGTADYWDGYLAMAMAVPYAMVSAEWRQLVKGPWWWRSLLFRFPTSVFGHLHDMRYEGGRRYDFLSNAREYATGTTPPLVASLPWGF